MECDNVPEIRKNLKSSTGIECTVRRDADGYLYRWQYTCGTVQDAFKTSIHEISRKFCKIMLVATVLYGSRDRKVVKQREIRNETVEVKFLRSVTKKS